ncbi:YitT family protein [Ferrimonas lipolytica]|uniref:YitT family protein n=1 Tax=Ferrimonas lipolytica TaxID=2724191 RepID=A0A6H1UGK7_9GAMM|nr:YitT family protein [Ferrimonas lipolytica]QIZ78237.1 YitT family protein [Ferrimonas lipolytica]
MKTSHALHEDLFSLSIGVLVLSVALVILKQAGVLVGGVAGLGLLISQLTDVSFGLLFFALSAPFYLMSWFQMSRSFTAKSLMCVGAISMLSEQLQHSVVIQGLTPLAAATIGGVLCGLGILVLFRHNGSAGGFNVLAIFCQERFGIRAGYLLMGLDLCILVATMICFGVKTLLASALCIVLMNLVIGLNHRPGRYVAKRQLATG